MGACWARIAARARLSVSQACISPCTRSQQNKAAATVATSSSPHLEHSWTCRRRATDCLPVWVDSCLLALAHREMALSFLGGAAFRRAHCHHTPFAVLFCFCPSSFASPTHARARAHTHTHTLTHTHSHTLTHTHTTLSLYTPASLPSYLFWLTKQAPGRESWPTRRQERVAAPPTAAGA